MTSTLAQQRKSAVDQAVAAMKSAIHTEGLTPDALVTVREQLKALAAHKDFWNETDFPPLAENEAYALYLVREDPDQRYSLYLNVMKAGIRIAPHDHTTWASVAAVEGTEHNELYKRTDDGKTPGVATLALQGTVAVGPGVAVALMPDDVHAIEIKGTQPIRHLHMYGRALDTLTERKSFDLATNTYSFSKADLKVRKGFVL